MLLGTLLYCLEKKKTRIFAHSTELRKIYSENFQKDTDGGTWPIDDLLLYLQSFSFTSGIVVKFLHLAFAQGDRKRLAQRMREQRRLAISCIPSALLASSPFRLIPSFTFPFPPTNLLSVSRFSPLRYILPPFSFLLACSPRLPYRSSNKNKNPRANFSILN